MLMLKMLVLMGTITHALWAQVVLSGLLPIKSSGRQFYST